MDTKGYSHSEESQFAITVRAADDQDGTVSHTVRCRQFSCPPGFLEIKEATVAQWMRRMAEKTP